MKTHLPLIIAFVASLILPRIPIVGKFFNIINTALHEFGHALMALLTNGSVHRIELFKDTSGTTTTKSNNRFAATLVALAGYPFAASVAWLAFYLIQNGAVQGFVVGLMVLFVLMLLFWIRNWYGAIWVVLFVGINVFLIYKGNEDYLYYAALFYAVMILTESVVSVLTLLLLTLRDSNKAGDSTNLAKFTHIPALIWSLLFVAYTGWVTYRVVLFLFY